LGGAALIDVDKNPRVVFAVRFALQRVLDLTQRPLPRGLGAIREKCLGEDLFPSQQFGDVLLSQGVEGLRFPSQAGRGVNLIVYKSCCDPSALKVENEAALRATIATIARSIK
jgi:hypothetical protein